MNVPPLQIDNMTTCQVARHRSNQFHPVFIQELKCIRVLKSHQGCINRLVWNETGTLLASVSDDLTLCLWRSVSSRSRPSAQLLTSHTANMFGVRFLPCTSDQGMVTGGMDGLVQLHHLERPSSPSCSSSSRLYCHNAAVKYVEVEPSSPHVFFSAGADGYVRQYDCRLPCAGCMRSNEGEMGCMFPSHNCLVRIPSGRSSGILSVRVCPVDTNLLLVGAGDPSVRIFDRRMLSLEGPDAFTRPPVQRFCPHHLASSSRAHPTYAEFSPCGRKVVATYHTDHCYVFDRYDEPPPSVWESCSISSLTPVSVPVSASEETKDYPSIQRQIGREPLPLRKAYRCLSAATDLINRQLFFLGLGAVARTLDLTLATRAPSSKTAMALTMQSLRLRGQVLLGRGYRGDRDAAVRDLLQSMTLLTSYRAQKQSERGRESSSSPIQGDRKEAKGQSCQKMFASEEDGQLDRVIEGHCGPDTDVREVLSLVNSTAHPGSSHSSEETERGGGRGRSRDNVTSPVTPSNTPVSPADRDYYRRYVGAANIWTDIKEAVFVGGNGETIAAASDCGSVFLWDTHTAEFRSRFLADSEGLNCIQAHPSLPLLATSGLDDVVRLWGPSRLKCGDGGSGGGGSGESEIEDVDMGVEVWEDEEEDEQAANNAFTAGHYDTDDSDNNDNEEEEEEDDDISFVGPSEMDREIDAAFARPLHPFPSSFSLPHSYRNMSSSNDFSPPFSSLSSQGERLAGSMSTVSVTTETLPPLSPEDRVPVPVPVPVPAAAITAQTNDMQDALPSSRHERESVYGNQSQVQEKEKETDGKSISSVTNPTTEYLSSLNLTLSEARQLEQYVSRNQVRHRFYLGDSIMHYES
eukprot:CAMPEP_0182418428 /NCGR_PEP_ID=MMETSP1167-20130531/2867_1 /TAXON_ID=2988 /ORGANISM="Mallomonas Sp, Strain CCMP3275" /LENGTH=859 /DNA_ID=CAMNT_0024592637 /DNA_START=63 /DNA_END=2642 /DNA_ORIENTATION=-